MTGGLTIGVEFAKVEVHCLIRLTRTMRDEVLEQRAVLEARHVAHGADISLQSAILELDNELYLIEACLTKLWRAFHGEENTPPIPTARGPPAT